MEKKKVKELTFGLSCNITDHSPWDCLHRHNEIEMSFFDTDKPVIFRIGGQVISLNRDSTLMFWAAIPHQIIEIAQGVKQYYITVPPHDFIAWNLPESLTQSILNGTILIEEDKTMRRMDIVSFPVWKKEAADTKNHQRRIAMKLSMEARIRRFGGAAQSKLIPFSQKSVLPAHASVMAKKHFFQIVDYITNNYKNDLKVEDCAKIVNLHPNYLISMFRRECGINITKYILMLRIYESQRLLLTTNMKIIDIAMEAGFGSISNFYKYFKKICGKNPNDYRKDVTS